MMTLLITGFEPFGGEEVNPSWEAVQRVRSGAMNARIERLLVPTTYEGSIETVTEAVVRLHPAVVLMVGQAGGRAELSVERLAVNRDDALAPDNASVVHEDLPIVDEGPVAYFASLPVREIVTRLHAEGLPAAVSNTAGLFVCNHLFYGVLHYIATHCVAIRAGFIHVPFLPKQVTERPGTPSMSLEDIVAGLQIAVDVLAGQT
ncbi:MAG: pyroglutamyl-peptidase I [Candidatus Cryosericum sp.]|nr:pyroglutamyl-peptidase I [bacterium]